jgi:hypothetical protein
VCARLCIFSAVALQAVASSWRRRRGAAAAVSIVLTRRVGVSVQSMSEPKPPIVLIGETGCGKSAILSNWVKSRRSRRNPAGSLPEFVFLHLAGSSRESSAISTLLLRVVTELKAFFGLQVPSVGCGVSAWRGACVCV